MRNPPIESWEIEAARRREVVKADFGGRHASRPDDGSQMVAYGDRGRVSRWISALTLTRVEPAKPLEGSAISHPHVGAIEPGS
jgi:hypothetical protein